MEFDLIPFENLFAIPQKNGLSKPKKVRGIGFPMINMGEIFAYDRIYDVEMDLVPMTEREQQSSFLKHGDLLFARQSLTLEGAGKCSIYLGHSEETTFESHLIRVRLDSTKCNPLFYYYFFQSYYGKKTISNIVEQVAAAGIRGSDLKKIKVPYTNLESQNKIINILNNIDLKIENNKKIIVTLEKISQALFKHWFIDFEFQNEQGHPYKSSGGKMVESELGEIPKGWKAGTADELFEFSPTEKLSKGVKSTYVEMKDLQNSAMVYHQTKREFKSGSKFRNGDTLLARITPCLENGKIGFVDFLEGNELGWGSTEFIVIRTKENIQKSFSYFFASEPTFKQYAIANMNGSSGRQRVKADTLAQYKLAIPPLKLIEKFTTISESNIKMMTNFKNQIVYLEDLRSTLLPKLLSGETKLPGEGVVG